MINDIIFRLFSLLIGYCFGMLLVGYFIGKKQNVDLRKRGSGNVGTTNTTRTLGKKAGALTLIGDATKPVLAMIVVWALFHTSYPESVNMYKLYACMGAILGHDFPFYLKFKGGKGIACTTGMILLLFPEVFPIVFVVFMTIVLTTKYVSLGSILGSVSYAISIPILGRLGYLVFKKEQMTEVSIIVIFLAVLAIWQHRSNIKRLMNGNENKFSFKS